MRFREQYAFLSNFYPAAVRLDGVAYPTVEHAYAAAKTLDRDARSLIASLSTPGKAKRAGRTVSLRADWDSVKVAVMRDLLVQKFCIHELRAQLLATGNTPLIEENDWGDHFWGVCDGVGENRLGQLLMGIRTDLGWSSARSALMGR